MAAAIGLVEVVIAGASATAAERIRGDCAERPTSLIVASSALAL
jgi:hypothetical protein